MNQRKDTDPKRLSVAELAAKLRLTVQRVYQLIDDDQMPHFPRGEDRTQIEIEEDEVLRWLYARSVARAPDPDAEDRRRKRKLEADRLQIELETLKGQRLDRTEVEALARAEEGSFVAFITGQLQRFEPDIVRASSPVDARKLTTQMKREILAARRDYGEQLEHDIDEARPNETGSTAA